MAETVAGGCGGGGIVGRGMGFGGGELVGCFCCGGGLGGFDVFYGLGWGGGFFGPAYAYRPAYYALLFCVACTRQGGWKGGGGEGPSVRSNQGVV